MDLAASVPTFVIAVLLISASPGPAMALIMRRAALHGFRGAVPTVLGLEAGLYVWALLAAGGFAALVAASEVAYLVLEIAFYLAIAAGVARAGTWFRRPRIRRRLEAVSGTVLVGLGVRLAVASR
ncbi:LysE family transporter [Pseudonocardia xinjiangensis]|uniref:LysE family transporter n=1 Tax=Pseudonocardia xinjiangensis TaxID=75289 RepID=A0ABX1RBW7_9PSEU|nr:LysE family transporter [Pseudonocardia xinjiangensis]NMH76909.1 LysE family transporter [Pseudonocardia xinjiangensis]